MGETFVELTVEKVLTHWPGATHWVAEMQSTQTRIQQWIEHLSPVTAPRQNLRQLRSVLLQQDRDY